MHRFILPLLVAFLAAVALPLGAQTSDVWTNTKISDLRRHQNEVSAPANERLQIAARYITRVQSLSEQDTRSPRQQKKLDKAYRRAVENLEEAIELEPEWLEPRLHLAALHYQLEAYDEAVRCYEGALEVQPGNQKVRSYLETARWYAEHEGEEEELEGG